MKKTVNPTRMELSKFKKKLFTAQKGHKLLKDKYDGLLKHFNELVKYAVTLREKTEDDLKNAQLHFLEAQSDKSDEDIEISLITNSKEKRINITTKNLMGVKIPKFEFDKKELYDDSPAPFGYFFSSYELNEAYTEFTNALPNLLKLSEIENTCILLANEIEKTRRRVNALEYVLIPDYRETIRYIKFHLEENERSTITRLLKIKNKSVQNAP